MPEDRYIDGNVATSITPLGTPPPLFFLLGTAPKQEHVNTNAR